MPIHVDDSETRSSFRSSTTGLDSLSQPSSSSAMVGGVSTHHPPIDLQTSRRAEPLPLRLNGNPVTLSMLYANVRGKKSPSLSAELAGTFSDDRQHPPNGVDSPGLRNLHSQSEESPYFTSPQLPLGNVSLPTTTNPIVPTQSNNSAAITSTPELPHPFPSQYSPTALESDAPVAVTLSSPTPTSPSRATTPRQQSPHPRSAAVPPVRIRSMNDLLADAIQAQDRDRTFTGELLDPQARVSPSAGTKDMESEVISRLSTSRERDPTRWSNLDDLIDKALFLFITTSDPPLVKHFLLTYRKFATPRAVLLGVQRRLKMLETKVSTDPMFASFSQIRICSLLHQWTRDYPADFATQGADAALGAIVKNLMSRTHTLYHGAVLMPFLENLDDPKFTAGLVSGQVPWGMQESLPGEDDDSFHVTEEEEEEEDEDAPVMVEHPRMSVSVESSRANGARALSDAELPVSSTGSPPSVLRNRTASLPLNFATSRSRSDTQSSGSGPNSDVGSSQLLTKLREVSHSLMFTNEATIAQELTMIELQMFLEIKPRDWLSSAFASGKRDPDKDPVAQFWFFANRMADWVASMILCRDKAKDRAKAVAKFVRIAVELRTLNNYSGLRSVLAGIGASAGEGEACMEIFRRNDRDGKLDKILKTYTVLLQPQRSHQTYRLALRQSLGAAIPAIDVHVSDLLRAHEGNPDTDEEDPSLIHWAKFSMLGKFVNTLVQCQIRCRASTEYRFKRDKLAYEMIMHLPIMTPDMQYARSIPIENVDATDPVSRVGPVPPSADAPRRESVIRRLFGR